MEVKRHDGIGGDLKKLKRFAAPVDSLESWERLFVSKGLAETPAVEQVPGFGDKKVYKARVMPHCVILVFLRYGIYHNEDDLLKLIKERLCQ